MRIRVRRLGRRICKSSMPGGAGSFGVDWHPTNGSPIFPRKFSFRDHRHLPFWTVHSRRSCFGVFDLPVEVTICELLEVLIPTFRTVKPWDFVTTDRETDRVHAGCESDRGATTGECKAGLCASGPRGCRYTSESRDNRCTFPRPCGEKITPRTDRRVITRSCSPGVASASVPSEKSRASAGNTNDGYCQMYAEPNVRKVREKFGEKVKQ